MSKSVKQQDAGGLIFPSRRKNGSIIMLNTVTMTCYQGLYAVLTNKSDFVLSMVQSPSFLWQSEQILNLKLWRNLITSNASDWKLHIAWLISVLHSLLSYVHCHVWQNILFIARKDQMEGTHWASTDKVPFDTALEGAITPCTGISTINLI